MKYWKKLSKEAIHNRVFSALEKNVNFYEEDILGIPGSHLDSKVFYHDAPFLKDAPFLSALIHNPNHIGCHTLGESERFFAGTQEIERELIALCAEQILEGEKEQFDGYVASGGTEANMQAIWIYRNYFMAEKGAKAEDICILCSEDSHYSMQKAANVLGVSLAAAPVHADSRALLPEQLDELVANQKLSGKKYFIVVASMMTTMFGSVDDVNLYTDTLDKHGLSYKVHVDGAYGGFFYPFTEARHQLDFRNPKVNSVTLDAHKMVQAPYGTGIFVIRKGYMHYANTKDASYVEGEDFTLIGSRSGANAIAIWMILMTYGRYGWEEKIMILQKRASWFVSQLDAEGISYFRDPHANIITIRSKHLNREIAARFGLVPDNHKQPNWYKVVIMEHVTIEKLYPLLEALKEFKLQHA